MTRTELGQWAATATNVAVLLSVALLVVQLRQNAEIARLDLLETRRAAFEQAEIAFLDPGISQAWAAAITDPKSMTLAEVRSMDAYQAIQLFQALRVYELEQAGLLDSSEAIEYLEADFPYVFGSRFAKAWWEVEGQTWSPGFVAFARPIVESIDEKALEEKYMRLQEKLRSK